MADSLTKALGNQSIAAVKHSPRSQCYQPTVTPVGANAVVAPLATPQKLTSTWRLQVKQRLQEFGYAR